MRTRDEVLREFPVNLQGMRDSYMEVSAYHVERMADRIRELEAEKAAVRVTDEMVEAAAEVGCDNGFDRDFDAPGMYWDAMHKVVTAAVTHPSAAGVT